MVMKANSVSQWLMAIVLDGVVVVELWFTRHDDGGVEVSHGKVSQHGGDGAKLADRFCWWTDRL